jgi:hypothetical protein
MEGLSRGIWRTAMNDIAKRFDSLEPFDLERAKRGDSIVTKSWGVTKQDDILLTSRKVVYVDDVTSPALLVYWEGRSHVSLYCPEQLNEEYLRMAPKPPKQVKFYVNIYTNGTDTRVGNYTYPTANRVSDPCVEVTLEEQADGSWKVVPETDERTS